MRLLFAIVLAFWFAAWTYGGYQLTAKDFAWLDEVPASQHAAPTTHFELPTIPKLPTTKDEAIKAAANLTVSQRYCLLKLATATQIAEIEHGSMPSNITAAQTIAMYACLKK